MKIEMKNVLLIIFVLFFSASLFTPAHAQDDPQAMRSLVCEKTFEIIIQCQQTALATQSGCDEIAGIISSPQTVDSIAQTKPAGSTDTMINQTVTLVAEMCKAACQNTKRGKLYKTAQEWISDGGCTIEVTR